MTRQELEIKSIKDLIKEEHKLVKEYNDIVEQMDYEAEFSGNIDEISKLIEKLNELIRKINNQRGAIATALNTYADPIKEVTLDGLRKMYPYSALSEAQFT